MQRSEPNDWLTNGWRDISLILRFLRRFDCRHDFTDGITDVGANAFAEDLGMTGGSHDLTAA